MIKPNYAVNQKGSMIAMTEDEIKARLRQNIMLLGPSSDRKASPLYDQVQRILAAAMQEHGQPTVQQWVEDLKIELGPTLLALLKEAMVPA